MKKSTEGWDAILYMVILFGIIVIGHYITASV